MSPGMAAGHVPTTVGIHVLPVGRTTSAAVDSAHGFPLLASSVAARGGTEVGLTVALSAFAARGEAGGPDAGDEDDQGEENFTLVDTVITAAGQGARPRDTVPDAAVGKYVGLALEFCWKQWWLSQLWCLLSSQVYDRLAVRNR